MAYLLDANVFKIPNACVGLGIKCMTPFAMLRHERARFVLGAHEDAVA